ncbi:3-oxoacyl-[acyl-carrier-protein] synthase III C-terminal domain-containing protein, partial [Chloroflexota bacterium]
SLTMGVAAAIDCLGDMDRNEVDGMYVASTTLPYKEKMVATVMAAAVDLRKDIITMDCVDSLRSGTVALRMAVDTVKAGSAKKVLVTVSDCRLGAPRSEFDQTFGDGAVAFLVGDSKEAVTLEAYYSVSNELLDMWRDTGRTVNTWEDRWVQEEGYMKVVPQVVAEFLEKYKVSLKDVTKVALYGNNPRRHGQVAKIIGISPEQLADPLYNTVGNTGAASALMMMVGVLEEAKAGDTIMVVAYGNGCDVMLLKVTEEIKNVKPKRGLKKHIEHKQIFPSYDMYFGFQPRAGNADGGAGPASSVVAREVDQIYPFKGTKCRVCGTVQYPPQRVCTVCKTKDEMELYRLSDKRAKLFLVVPDYAAPTPPYANPAMDIMVDWEGGGRALSALTDNKLKPEDVPVGMDLEMTFRKLRAGGGIHHYWWKFMPLRESWIHKEEK